MAKSNKTRIPLNRKSIDEIDTDYNKEISLDSETESNEDSDPFNNADTEDINSNLFEGDISDDFEEIDSPFWESEEDESIENPFSDVSQPNENDYDDIASIVEPPPLSTPNVDLVIDPNIPYFFVFGNSTAGKSAMVSGLLFYIQTSRIGQLRSLSLNDQKHHQIGDYLLSQMTKKVRNGKFVSGNKPLDVAEFVFPTEINLEFQPTGKTNMPFCLLEMAGEDLREIELRDEGKAGGNFDARIDAYLQHPDCNLKFICVVDIDTPENSEDLINQFLRYIHKAGHTKNPVLITVNKWDKIADQYNDVKDYLEEKLPILTNNLFDDNRDMAYMKFSIGDVVSDPINGDTYEFKPEDSKKLLEWMYETATGDLLFGEVKTSAISKIFKSIKNIFSNG